MQTSKTTDTKELYAENEFGYCCYEITENKALIYNLYVYPEYRLQGKARELVQFVINTVREAGCKGEIGVEVEPREDSIDVESLALFYKSMQLTVLKNSQDMKMLPVH